MENLFSFLQLSILGNRLQDYLVSLLIFLSVALTLSTLKRTAFGRLRKFAEKTTTKADDLLIELLSRTFLPLLYVGAFYIASKQLHLAPMIDKVISAFTLIVLTVQLTRMILAVATYLLERGWLKKREAETSTVVSKSILTILRVGVWGLGVVFVLDNLGFNISAVVAGLGIGGVAVALAAQTILGDLFNYFVIFFDKPFEEGDFIVFEDYMGTIEHVGIKSTRIRSLGGEQIIISNSNLTASKIRNYKRMAERRIIFVLGVIYETSDEQLKKIPSLVQGIIKSVPNTRFDRAHFKSFGSYSLDFEVVYYVLSPDYNQYMDIQQRINFEIKSAFEKEKIEFAYPTQVEYFKESAPAVSKP